MAGIWDWQGDIDRDTGIVGYGVKANDGEIGKVDEKTDEAESSYIVVDTGPWIFGKKVLLPAGVVMSIDHDNEVVAVSRSKDEIKDAPEFDEGQERTGAYRAQYGEYYSGL